MSSIKVDIAPGKYVVAVSGGVDSVVLLDLLSKNSKEYELIVAHFDHGIRSDSKKDREYVQAIAEQLRLPFEFAEGKLGSGASEAMAREARYKFLNHAVSKHQADALVTAHHQDDLLETAIINLMRGTNRKGLTSLASGTSLVRPLLKYSKAEIKKYAKSNQLGWREDPTNQDTNYLRNRIRHEILPQFSAKQKREMLKHIQDLRILNEDIDIIANDIAKDRIIQRHLFISLDHNIAREVMASWLRRAGVRDIDSKQLELLVRAAKTYESGKKIDIDKDHLMRVSKDKLALVHVER